MWIIMALFLAIVTDVLLTQINMAPKVQLYEQHIHLFIIIYFINCSTCSLEHMLRGLVSQIIEWVSRDGTSTWAEEIRRGLALHRGKGRTWMKKIRMLFMDHIVFHVAFYLLFVWYCSLIVSCFFLLVIITIFPLWFSASPWIVSSILCYPHLAAVFIPLNVLWVLHGLTKQKVLISHFFVIWSLISACTLVLFFFVFCCLFVFGFSCLFGSLPVLWWGFFLLFCLFFGLFWSQLSHYPVRLSPFYFVL